MQLPEEHRRRVGKTREVPEEGSAEPESGRARVQSSSAPLRRPDPCTTGKDSRGDAEMLAGRVGEARGGDAFLGQEEQWLPRTVVARGGADRPGTVRNGTVAELPFRCRGITHL